jgi:fibronectin-binding autotransporter adhesin
MSPSLRARWGKWFGGRRPRGRSQARSRATSRPAFEHLEDRVVPATRVWSGLGVDSNWQTAANWAGSVAPSAGDDLVFPGGAAQAATSNNDFAGGTSFRSITLDGAGYTLSGNAVVLGAGGLTVDSAAGAGTDTIALAGLTLGGSSSITNRFAGVGLVINPGIDTGSSAGNTLTFGGSGSITVNGAVSDAGSVVVSGPGTLLLTAGGTYAATTINGGVLQLPATLSGNVTVNFGGTLQLQTGAALTGSLLTLNGGGVGGGVVNNTAGALEISSNLTLPIPIALGSNAAIGVDAGSALTLTSATPLALAGKTLTLNSAGSTTISSALGTGGSAGNLAVNSALTGGTVKLTGASGYNGSTTIAGGTVDLTGTLASTSYTITQNATLLLDDAGLTTSPVHVPQTAPIGLSGGTITFAGSTLAAEAETIGTITLNSGQSNIRVNPVGGRLAQLSAQSLTRKKGATVNFGSTGTLGSATARLFFNAAPTSTNVLNGTILPYATINDTDFATYNGFTNGASAFAGYVTNPANLAAVATNSVVKLTGAATLSAPATLAGLVVSGTSLTMTNANTTLTDTSGGLILINGASVNPLAGALGTLAFGASEGFVFSNATSGTADTITTTISGSGGVDLAGPVSPAAASLVIDPGVFSNNYSGGTFLDSANVSLNQLNALGTAANSPVTFVGGALSSVGTALNPYLLANAVNFVGAQTAINTFLTLTGPVTLSGNTALTLSQSVTITGLISGPATAPLAELGTGTLILNPQGGVNNYSGGTVLAGGTLILNSINNPLGSFTSPLTLVSGTFESDVVGAPIPGPVNLFSANVTLGGASPNNGSLVFSGPVTTAGSNTLQVVAATTFSGVISGSGGITEQGTGALVLGGADTYTGSTMVNAGSVAVTGSLAGAVGVSGGTLFSTGATGPVAVGPAGTFEPLNPTVSVPTNGVAAAPRVNFSEGGTLTIPVSAYATPGTSFGQLVVGGGGGAIVVGGSTSVPTVLAIDLGGLPAGATGQALGAIQFGSALGTPPVFTELRILNNPFNYAAALQYTANGVNVIITQGTNVNQPPPPPTTTFIWSGASALSSKWSDAGNWLGGVAPTGTVPAVGSDNGQDLIFPAGSAQALTGFNDLTTASFTPTFHSITVEAGGYALLGGAIILQNNLTATEPPDAGTPTVTVAVPITIAPSQADFGRTTTIVSTYAGTSLVLANTATTQITTTTDAFGRGIDLTLDGSGNFTINDQITGPGGVQKVGTGTLFLSPSNPSGNNYLGRTRLTSGVTVVASNNPLGSNAGTGTLVNPGATLQTVGAISLGVPILIQGTGVSAGGFANTPGAIDVTGTGILSLTNSLSLNGNATVDVSSAAAGLNLTGQVNLKSSTLTIYALGPVFAPTSIDPLLNASTGSLVFDGTPTGSLSLTASNNFTGSLVVNSGTVTLSGGGALAGVTGIHVATSVAPTTANVYAGGVGTLVLDDTGTNIPRLNKNAVLFLDGGDFIFKGRNQGTSAETIAAITLEQGASYLQMLIGNGITARLNLTFDHVTLTNPAATVDFYGAGLGGNQNRLIWANTTSRPTLFDNMLPWATVFDPSLAASAVTRNFATFTIQPDNTLFFGALGTYNLNPNTSAGLAGSVVVLDATRLGYTPLTIAAPTTFGALVLRNGAQVTVNPGASLTVNFGLLSDGGGAANGVVTGAGGGTDPVLNFGSSSPAFSQGVVTAFVPLTLSTAIGNGPNGATAMQFGGDTTIDLVTPTDAAGNTWTGGTTVNGGTVLLDSTDNPFGAASSPITFAAGVLSINTLNVNVGSAVTIANPIIFNGSNFDFATKTAGAALALAFGAAVAPANTVALTGTNELAIPLNMTLTINDQITGAGGLIVTGGGVQPGAGTLVLGDKGGTANSYSGGTTLIDQGANVSTLIVADGSALGTGPLTLVNGLFAATSAVTLPNALILSQANVTLGGTAPNNGAINFSGTSTNVVTLTGVSTLNTTAVPVTFSGKVSDGGVGGAPRGSLNTVGNLTLSSTEAGSQTGQTATTGGILQLDGTQTTSPVPVNKGTLYGNGNAGPLSVSSTGVVNPGTPTAIGTLTAAGANFSDSGTLRLRVKGWTTAGTDFDQLVLGTKSLVVGGNSRLVLDLTGLTVPQVEIVNNVVSYGGTTGSPIGNVPVFNEVDVVNNPNNFAVELDYTATGLNLKIGLGSTDAPVLTLPPAQTSKEYFSLPFSSANGNAIGVTDVGAAASGNPLQVSLSIPAGTGTLSLAVGTPGLAGNGTTSVSFTDFAGNVTADLNSLVFQPTFGFTGGPFNLTISVTNTAIPTLLGPTETATGAVPITITFVRFAPSFTAGGDVTVFDTNGTYNATWATNIQGLPPAGSTTGLYFTTTNNDPGLFSPTGQPTVAPDGTLTFTPIPGVGGNAAVTVVLNAPTSPVISSNPVTFFIHVISTGTPTVSDVFIHWGTRGASVNTVLAYSVQAALNAGLASHPDVPFQGITAIDLVFNGKVTINNVPPALTITGRNPMTGALTHYTLTNPIPVPTPAGDTGFTLEWKIVGTTLAAVTGDEAITLSLNGAQVVNPANGRPFAGTYSFTFQVLAGDVNGDGVVDLKDELAIARALAIRYSGIALLLDLDGDGSITMQDYFVASKRQGNRGF